MYIINQIKSLMEENEMHGIRGWLLLPLCITCSLFFLYTAYFGSFPSLIQRTVLLVFCTSMVFLSKPAIQKHPRISMVIDLLLVAAAFVGFGYTFFARDHIDMNIGMPHRQDFVFGIICIITVVEATRRKTGAALPIMAGIFVLYGIFGRSFPGLLRHGGMDAEALITALYMSEEGIFGMPTMAAANFIMAFILFGAFLAVSGVGDAFSNIGIATFGKMRGGPAKACVVSSSLVALTSGSAVANVVTTGPFTIPLMKKTGYSPTSAGAIEAIASTGGQIMPPIMGAAAFIMADIVGVPYWEIVRAAFIPAILYYIALFFIVDLEAAKYNLRSEQTMERSEKIKVLLGSWLALVPIFTLVYFLGVARLSPQRSAFFTIIVIIILSMFKRGARITPKKFITALIRGAKSGMEIGVVCACAGILVSIILRSGLGLRLTGILIEISGGHLLTLLIVTMIASIVLGMGLTTSAAYIIIAILIAPAMVRMGAHPIAAHLFAFYFGCLSAITPPVALASFAGASLAGSPPTKTAWMSVRYGLCGFIVPYMFVFGPALIGVGTIFEILQAVIFACIGVYFLSISLVGFQFTKVNMFLRPAYFACALLMIHPGLMTDIIGISIAAVLSLFNYWAKKKLATATV